MLATIFALVAYLPALQQPFAARVHFFTANVYCNLICYQCLLQLPFQSMSITTALLPTFATSLVPLFITTVYYNRLLLMFTTNVNYNGFLPMCAASHCCLYSLLQVFVGHICRDRVAARFHYDLFLLPISVDNVCNDHLPLMLTTSLSCPCLLQLLFVTHV